MKKKINIVCIVSAFVSLAFFIVCLVGLCRSIKYAQYTHFVHNPAAYENIASYSGMRDIIMYSILGALSLLVTTGIGYVLYGLNRTDLSELTKGTLQSYREKKAARQESKRQKKIDQAKQTLAELEAKHKDDE